MDVAYALSELGGVATRAQLLERCTDRELRAAVADGAVIRVAHGRYSLARRQRDVQVAQLVHGVLSHQSAALVHRWPIARDPDLPVVTVPRKRSVPLWQRREADLRYADLSAADVDGQVTSAERTLQDCLRTLPFPEALAVADSAIRVGGVSDADLARIAQTSPRSGRPQALRVAGAADPRAATPFESVVRGLSLDVPGLRLVPQVRVAPSITPDLVDEALRLVVECDSWTYRAELSAFRRDQERFNELGLRGWLVVRFGLTHALDRPAYVQEVLTRAARRLAEIGAQER